MSMSDPISDMLTRIRNGQKAHMESIIVLASKMNERILDVLVKEGYIRGFTPRAVSKGINEIVVELKYYEGESVIREIQRVSNPGRRVYSAVTAMPRVANGLGITIVSTPKGVMADHSAREQNVGGEVLCRVF